MQVHLIDGTYELFRYHFAPGRPERLSADGLEVGATEGVIRSMLSMVNDGVTHIAVATDHVIESWRNDLYDGYKDGSGVPPELFAQFELVEEGLELAGFKVWPMIEFEADDGLAAGAAMAAQDARVERVFICTPDKDLAQCVTADGKVVQFDRRKRLLIDEAGVIEKFGVKPASIPDYLALVGDTADGFPGLKGGAPSRRRPCCLATTILRTSPRRRASGTSRCEAPPSSPQRWSRTETTPICSAASPPSTPRVPRSAPSTISPTAVPSQGSPSSVTASARLASFRAERTGHVVSRDGSDRTVHHHHDRRRAR